MNHQRFDEFLLKMLAQGKLTPRQLANLSEAIARRIMDNADNRLGAPTLGSGTGVVLQGQLAEIPGTIKDLKGQIADNLERKEEEAKKQTAQKQAERQNVQNQKQENQSAPPKPSIKP